MKQKQLLSIFVLVLALALLAACSTPVTPTPAVEEKPTEVPATEAPTAEPEIVEPVEVRWYVGLGAGSDEGTFEPQQAVVDEFNASQEKIVLKLEIVANAQAYDTLATQISGGNAPDIVGPVGIRGRDSFKGAWMDLQPMIDETKYDLSDFDPASVAFLAVKEEGQLGIPFAIYPSFIFVNKNLFDEAGLPYPPQEYGAPYVDETGAEKPWNLDTVKEIGMKLTVDANGNDATSANFDPENIVQFGYLEGLTDMRGALTLFGPGSLVADDGKTAQFPDNWRTGAKWVYDAMWTDHFWPTDAYINSDVLQNGNPFQSGNMAMMHCHTWFAATWALDPTKIDFSWDMAVVPEADGQTTAKMHADTFGILKGSKHPKEAFEVLTYMSSAEVAPKLLAIYGGIPARLSLQTDYIKTYTEKTFPGQEINWQVAMDSVKYADNPNHESWMPSFQETSQAYGETWTKLQQESGLDVDKELDDLVVKLQGIFDAAAK